MYRVKKITPVHKIKAWLNTHQITAAVILLLAYLFTWQLPYMTTGSVWAEAYMEYLPKAINGGWYAVIAPSWEGYVTFLPSLFTRLFTQFMPGALGFVDVYFAAVTVLFTIFVLAVTVRLSRPIIPALWQRLMLAVGLLLPLWHLSAFSFINVWYVGFVPIMLLAFSPNPLRRRYKILYVLGAISIAFSKPSTVLLPFVVYRAIRTKEYVSNAIIAAAICLQTYLLFFATSDGTRHIALSIVQVAQALYVSCGTELLKLLHIAPNNWLVLVADLALLGLAALLVWRRGWFIAGLVTFSYVFLVYAYVLAPGPDMQTQTIQAATIFNDYFKVQREILIWQVLIIGAGLLMPDAWNAIGEKISGTWRSVAYSGALVLFLLVGMRIYQPIDTTSVAVASNIDAFRSDLNMGRPACMPVSPTPAWSEGTNWYFAYKGGCKIVSNPPTDSVHVQTAIGKAQLHVSESGPTVQNLMAVRLLVRLQTPSTPATFFLRDTLSGTTLTALARGANSEGMQYIAFNTSALPKAQSYNFIVSSTVSAYVATTSSGSIASTAYFMTVPATAR